MPLTLEQFKKLSDEGLSPEEIAAFDSGKTPDEMQVSSQDTQNGTIQQPADNASKEEWEQYYKATAPNKSGVYTQAAAGAIEGVQNLPFGKRIIPEESKLSQFAKSVESPDSVGGTVYRGFGQAAPAMLPIVGIGRGVSAASQLPKLGALAEPAMHMGSTMGIYEGARSAANQEGNPLIEAAKGFIGGAALGKAAQLGANVVPKQIPGAERLGSAIGGAALSGIEQMFNPEAPAHEKLGNVILSGGLMASMPVGRKADIDARSRAMAMKSSINTMMNNIGIRPSVRGKTGETLNQAKDKINTAFYNIWSKGRKNFTGPDQTPANTQEVLNAIKEQKDLEILNMKSAEEMSKGDPQVIQGKKKRIDSFVIDGNDVARSLRSTLTANKKILEASGDYDIKAIRQRLAGLKDKSFTIDEVDSLLKELNTSYGKTTVQAKIDRALADALRDMSEKKLDSISSSAGKDWRQARRNWGALRELESQFLKIHNKHSETVQEGLTLGEKGQKLVEGAKNAVGFALHPAKGTLDLIMQKYNTTPSKNPLNQMADTFRALDKQYELRTLNQEMSDLYKSKITKNIGKAVSGIAIASGLSSSANASQISDEDKLKTILGEAESSGIDGMRAVASTLNNSNPRAYGKDVISKEDGKYYATRKGKKRLIPNYVVVNARRAIKDSNSKDFSNGANHWFSDADLKTSKVQKMIKDGKMKFIIKVGGNSFYKE